MIGIEYTLFILLADAPPEVNGVEFGVVYSPSIGVLSWRSCSQFQAPMRTASGERWPTSGSGNMLVLGDEIRGLKSGGSSVLIGTLDVIADAPGTLEFTGYPRESDAPWESGVCIATQNDGAAWITYPDNTGAIGFGAAYSGRDPCSSESPVASIESLSIEANSPIVTRIEGPHPSHSTATWVVTSNRPREVTASIFSVTGGLLRSFQPFLISQGTTQVVWDGRDAHGTKVASGSYFFVVRDASGYKAVQRTVLLR